MIKKMLALCLAAVLLLTPLTASAVTWTDIRTAILSAPAYGSSNNFSVQVDDTTVSYDQYAEGEKINALISVTGGTIEITESLHSWHIGNGPIHQTEYSFNNVHFSNNSHDIHLFPDNQSVSLALNNVTGLDSYYIANYLSGKSGVTNSGSTNSPSQVIVGLSPDAQTELANLGSTAVISGYTPYPAFSATAAELKNYANQVIKGLTIDGKPVSPSDLSKLRFDMGALLITPAGPIEFTVYYAIYDEQIGDWLIYQDVGGQMVLVEDQPEEEPYDYYKAKAAEEEALRQARGIGGVTTSIFWNKQMYLGHSTYNGRVYYKGELEMTLQSLNWLPGGAKNGKNYTLRINKADVNPADVEIRLAQDIVDVCDRAGIVTITLVDKNLAPITQYAVSDLLAAREMYGLEADELLCISADPEAEVTRITADGVRTALEETTETAAE